MLVSLFDNDIFPWNNLSMEGITFIENCRVQNYNYPGCEGYLRVYEETIFAIGFVIGIVITVIVFIAIRRLKKKSN